MMFAADSGFLASLRAQFSLQYRIELQGVVICFSHMALYGRESQADNDSCYATYQYCKKQAAISSGLPVPKLTFSFLGEPSKVLLLAYVAYEVFLRIGCRGLLVLVCAGLRSAIMGGEGCLSIPSNYKCYM